MCFKSFLHFLYLSLYLNILSKYFILSVGKHESQHEVSNNVVCATSKASDQPAHMLSLIRAFASRLNIL